MFWSVFSNLCEKNNTNPTNVAKALGLSSGSPTSWKGGKVPHHNTLLKIANYFDVSVDYLLGKEEKPTENDELSENTKKLIEFAQSLTEEQAKIAIKLLKAIIEE